MPETLPYELLFRNWSALRYWLVWAYDGMAPRRALVGHYGSDGNPDVSCWLIRRGHVEVKAAGEVVIAKKGQWLLVSTGKRYQRFSADCEILSVHVNLAWPGGMPVVEQPVPYVFDAREFPDLEKSSLALVQSVKTHFPDADANLAEHGCDMLTFLEVQHQLPLWVKHYLTVQAAHGIFPTRLNIANGRILSAINELETRPLSQRFCEKELIQRVGLSQSRLNFLFNQAIGLTPKRFFERRRVEAATKLLNSTQMSVKEIGFELGFRYDSHFSHWFRRQTGTTPSGLRNRETGAG